MTDHHNRIARLEAEICRLRLMVAELRAEIARLEAEICRLRLMVATGGAAA